MHIVVVPRDPALTKSCADDPLAESRTIEAYERITAASGGHLFVSKRWSLADATSGLTDLRRITGFMYQDLVSSLLSTWLSDSRLSPHNTPIPDNIRRLEFPTLDPRDTILVRYLVPPVSQREKAAGSLYDYMLSFAIDKCVEEFEVVVSGERVYMQLYNPRTSYNTLYLTYGI